MVTELVTFKLEGSFLREVDIVTKTEGFHSRTEFIRAALREKMEDLQIKKAMLGFQKLPKTDFSKRHQIKEAAFNEFKKTLR